MKKRYVVPVRFTGKIEYEVWAESEKAAMILANDQAMEETDFNKLEDIDWDVKAPMKTN